MLITFRAGQAQHLSIAAWSFAKLGAASPKLFSAIGQALAQQAQHLDPQGAAPGPEDGEDGEDLATTENPWENLGLEQQNGLIDGWWVHFLGDPETFAWILWIKPWDMKL